MRPNRLTFPAKRNLPRACWLLAVACALVVAGRIEGHGAANPKQEDLKTVEAIDVPPQDKALINFLRPSDHMGDMPLSIYDSAGACLVHLLGKTRFQLVCEPGEHVVIGSYPLNVSVVKAQVEAGKVYDIMIDRKGFGFALVPLAKGDARRSRLPEFERQARAVVYLRTERVAKYEKKQKPDIEKIKRDFLGGKKSERLSIIQKDDCR